MRLRQLVPLLVSVMGAALAAPDPPTGVSRELARERRARIGAVEYRLRFDVVPEAAEVAGFARIAFELGGEAEPTADLVLDFGGSALEIASINARKPDDKTRTVGDHVVIARELLVRGTNWIEASFRSPVAATGTPLTRYDDPADGARYLYTLLVPSDAHALFPCFDQPDLKATFRLTLTMPSGLVAIANTLGDVEPAVDGLAEPERERERGREVVAFRPTRPLPTYLFAFAVGPFALVDDDRGAGLGEDPARPLRMALRRSQLAHVSSGELFAMHRDALGRLGEWFGIPYAFDKLEFVLLPGFPYGGMEHAGAIFYRESALVFERPPTEPERVRRSTLIYHEVAHQWFGNLVTMEWFDDLWLKEGFATFLAYDLLDRIEPERLSWLRFLQRVKLRAYAIDATSGTTPIWQQLGNLADAKSAYGAIVYNKAPAVLRELEARLGKEGFRAGVRRFVQDHAFGNATWEQLVAALRAHGGLDDEDWSRRWILGKGLPSVRVEWRADDDGRLASFAVTQRGAIETDPAWPLVLELRLFERGDDGSVRTRDITVRSKSRRTEIEELVGQVAPIAVLPNPRDVAYALLTLDPVSLRWFASRVESIEDPLTRVAATVQLWQSTRELELPPQAMADALLAGIERERDPDTHEWLLGQLEVVLGRWLTGNERARRLGHAERLARAQLLGDLRGSALPLLRFLASVSSSRETLELLRGVLDGSVQIQGLQLAPRDRFQFAAALLAAGDRDAVERERTRAEAGTDVAKWAFVAGAASPDPAVKARYFADYLRADGPPEQWVQDSLANFHWSGQSELTLPYLTRALEQVEEVKRTRKIFFMPAWIDAFVNGHSSPAARDAVLAFLASHPQLDPDIVGKVNQSLDELERAVRIRARW
ncbi:MAG: ERAP1-like C-terminal domain-containing protein [Planctomycetes bacterium]|nr:ERAP1-like C-terminal domain-containing protein [Planctomycetota bacterium]